MITLLIFDAALFVILLIVWTFQQYVKLTVASKKAHEEFEAHRAEVSARINETRQRMTF